MATIPSETTAVAGTVLTAATWNANVRDAINFILAPPFAVLRQTVAQSIANAAWVGATLDAEDLDRDNGHSTSSNTSRYTAQTAGWYAVRGAALYTANGTGSRAVAIQINGAFTARYSKMQIASSGASATTGVITMHDVYFNVGDYVELALNQTSGVALNTNVSEDGAPGSNPSLTVRWIST
jgi:hypothetical protein